MIRLILYVLVVALSTAPADAQKKGAVPPANEVVVASFAGQAITAGELEQEVAARLLSVRQQEYQIKSEGIRELVFRRRLEQVAREAGISVEELIRREVTEKAALPSEEQVTQVFQRYRAQLSPDDAQAREQVVQGLTEQLRQERLAQYRQELLARADVRILLEPPRAAVSLAGHEPIKGPAKAAVTLVEFSDFQCPYCASSKTTMAQIQSVYGDKVRFVFKHFPLNMHKDARRAAEASLCAADQGKFWELHDWMFAHPKQLSERELVEQARALGLDGERFQRCLAGGEKGKMIAADMAAALGLGITGTPAFVINGRLVMGAQPFEAFKEIIDDELARSSSAVTGRR